MRQNEWRVNKESVNSGVEGGCGDIKPSLLHTNYIIKPCLHEMGNSPNTNTTLYVPNIYFLFHFFSDVKL